MLQPLSKVFSFYLMTTSDIWKNVYESDKEIQHRDLIHYLEDSGASPAYVDEKGALYYWVYRDEKGYLLMSDKKFSEAIYETLKLDFESAEPKKPLRVKKKYV